MTRRRRLLRLNDAGELELDGTGVSNRLMAALGGKEDRLGDTQTSLPDNQAVYMGDQPGTAEKPATQQIATNPSSAAVSPEQNAGAFDRRPMNERITSLNERLNQGSQNAGETAQAVVALRQAPPPAEDVPPPSVVQAAQTGKGPQEPHGNQWLRRMREEEPHAIMGRWSPEAGRESKRIEQMRRERDSAVGTREDVAGIGSIIAAAFRAPQSSLDRAAGAGQRLADQMDGRINERQDALNAERTARYASDPSNPVNVSAAEAAAEARRQRLAEIELHTQGSAASAQAAREAADARAREDRASREREGQANRDSAMERARLRRGGGGGGGGVNLRGRGLAAPGENLPISDDERILAREILQQRHPEEGYDPGLDLGDVLDPRMAVDEVVALNRMGGVDMAARGAVTRPAASGVRADAPLTNQQENQSRQNYQRQNGGLIAMRRGLAEAEGVVNSMNDRDLALASEALNRSNGNVQQAMTMLSSNPQAGTAVNTLQNLTSLIALSRSGKAVSDRERQMLTQAIGAGQFVNVSALREGLARVRRAADEDFRVANQAFSSVVDENGNFIGQEPAPSSSAAVNPAHVQALVQEAERRGRPLTPEQAEEMLRRRAGR